VGKERQRYATKKQKKEGGKSVNRSSGAIVWRIGEKKRQCRGRSAIREWRTAKGGAKEAQDRKDKGAGGKKKEKDASVFRLRLSEGRLKRDTFANDQF